MRPSASKKDGHPARLSIFPALIILFLIVLAAPACVLAAEDFFEAGMGLDYITDLGLAPSETPATWPESYSFPGFASPAAQAPIASIFPAESFTTGSEHPSRFSAYFGSDYRNLLRKSGRNGFDFTHGDLGAETGFRAVLGPGLALTSSLRRQSTERSLGDSDLSLDLGGTAWEGRTTVSLPLAPWLNPEAGVAWDSRGSREHSLLGVALRGSALRGSSQPEISWALITGRRTVPAPLRIDLPRYLPMSVPFLLRQDFHALSLVARRGPAELAYSARLRVFRGPGPQREPYALSDSGSLREQRLRFALRGGRESVPWRMESRLETASGRHTFRGTSQDGDKGNRPYPFSYLDALQRSLSARLQVEALFGGLGGLGGLSRHGAGKGPGYTLGLFGGMSALEWNALRPDLPAGKHFWDRNGVLDSYQGNVLGVFNRETWLLDGSALLRRTFAGGFGEGTYGSLRGRFALSWQRVALTARSRLTKRTALLLLAYSEEDTRHRLPDLTAHLLTPELRLSLPLGGKDMRRSLALEAHASQAIPLRVSWDRETSGGSQGPRNDGDESYAGGTRVGLGIRWGRW